MSPRQGGDSYPSGTPPYGVSGDAAFSRAGQPPQAGRPTPGDSSDRDEPRTETTLTTRIKINIPGSRPIPEVVVRSPLNEETGEQSAPRRRRADTSGSPVLGVMDSGSRTATPPDLPPEWLTPEDPAEPSASEWFAPRKKSAPPAAPAPAPAPSQPLFQEQPAPQPGAAPGYQTPGRQPAAPQAPATPTVPTTGRQTPAGQGATGQTPMGQTSTSQSPDGPPPGYDMPYGSGRDAMPGSPAQPWATGAPRTQVPGQQPAPQPTPGQPPQAAQPGPQTLPPRPVPGARAARLQGATGAPAGDTLGGGADGIAGGQPTLQFRPPVDPLTDPLADPRAGFQQAAGGTATMPGPVTGTPTITTPIPGQAGPTDPFAQFGQQGPLGQPGGQPGGTRRAGKGGKAPQQGQPGAKAGGKAGAKAGAGNASGRTATLPVPQHQSAGDGFAGGTGGAGAEPRPEPAGGGKGTGASTAPSSAAKRGGGKGRKLAGYAVGALVLAGAGAYGAGLMLNQADIPKGTTVLGYSIGGDTRDQAVTALTRTLGGISAHPLTVSIGGRTATLNPSVAGLTIDTSATVDGVAHHDYNPVTVIESLLGQSRAVTPVVTIDQDKLRSALQQLASGGSASGGSVRFTSAGKAVVTPPKAGSSLDVNASIPLVEQAFKARATGGQDSVVTLPVGSAQPKADATAANEAAQTIGAWAMKQPFKITAGGRTVPFGPHTFSQALTLQPDASGAFVPVFNLAKLKAAYGPGFEGVHTKAGQPVTPQDVATALVALLEKPNGATSIAI